jgi:lysophospholipase
MRRAIPAAAVETSWHLPGGHPIRRIDWPVPAGPAKGSLLFMPGRGDAYEKYLETFDHWARAGWQVSAADWRGQAGSGRLGADKVTGHVDDFSTWIGDLAALWSYWKAERPGPYVLAGHSMGGHLALRAVMEQAVDPDALVLSAPMLGFHGILPRPAMHRIASFMAGIGDPRRPAWKWSEKPGEVPAGRNLLLTHDDDRYADELWWRKQRPELVMGPGSWGWVERAYASIEAIFAPGALEAVEIPTCIIATAADRLVRYRATAEAARRLPNAELLTFGREARHEILREEDSVRDRALAFIDTFLDRIAAQGAAQGTGQAH